MRRSYVDKWGLNVRDTHTNEFRWVSGHLLKSEVDEATAEKIDADVSTFLNR
jgi:hypothetical protein